MMELFKKVFKDLFSGNVKKTENKDIEYETKIPKQQVTPPRISNKNTIKKNDERRSNKVSFKKMDDSKEKKSLEVKRKKVHHYNHLWKIAQSIPDLAFDAFWEDMKSDTQIELIDQFYELIELVKDPENENMVGIIIKDGGNAAHIPMHKIPKRYRSDIK